jgi:hypothetical protein
LGTANRRGLGKWRICCHQGAIHFIISAAFLAAGGAAGEVFTLL